MSLAIVTFCGGLSHVRMSTSCSSIKRRSRRCVDIRTNTSELYRQVGQCIGLTQVSTWCLLFLGVY